jgi:SAM-dependent methyltransferase
MPPATSSPRPFDLAPGGVLERILAAIAPGPLLYLGPLDDRTAARFSSAGFDIEVVAFAPDAVLEWPAVGGTAVAERILDPATMVLPDSRYALVVLDGVLSSLPPRDGERLVSAVRRAVRPGGVVYASAYTVADPEFAAACAAEEAVARNAVLREDGWHRFLLRGELAMAFGGWMVLHAADELAGNAPGTTRATTVLVARRPVGGSLLA